MCPVQWLDGPGLLCLLCCHISGTPFRKDDSILPDSAATVPGPCKPVVRLHNLANWIYKYTGTRVKGRGAAEGSAEGVLPRA